MGINPSKVIIDKAINEQMKAQQKEHVNKVLNVNNHKSKCQKPQKLAPEKVGYADFDSTPIQENSFAKGKMLRKIIPGRDGRVRVNETRQWPHSVHGLLSMKFDNSPIPYTGTATMIGPNIAITAAHNLYNFETKTEASDVHLYPAANDHLLPFGAVKVQAFYYPEEYKTTKKEDYALLILEHDIGEQTGYFGLHAIERPDIEGKMVNITGYPADKVVDYPKQHQMWGMEGPASSLDDDYADDLISYEIDTYAGQSGSGIWYDAGGEYYIIGVHNCIYNQGTFLNKRRIEKIREWILLFYLLFYSELERAQLFQSIDLSGKGIGEKEAEYLSKAKFPQLQSLNLSRNQIEAKAAEYLSKATFSKLQSLVLDQNKVGDKGAEHLSKANFPHLQLLSLHDTQIGDKGAEYLSKATFPQLQSLNLFSNQIGEKGAEYLSKANFPQLLSLDLSSNKVGDKGAEYVSRANFPQLQSLYLFGNQIGEKGVEYLSKANFPKLQSLDLSSNQVGDKGAEYLSKPNFPQLQSLNLHSNQIGEKGAEYLSKSNFPQLQSLHLYANQIGDKGAEFLIFMKSHHPNRSHLYIQYSINLDTHKWI